MRNIKVFRCHFCGEKVAWSAISCPVCKRLISNDRIKLRIKSIIWGITIMMLAEAIMHYTH